MLISDIKKHIYQIIRDDDNNHKPGFIYDTAIIVVIIINVMLAISATFDSLSPEWRIASHSLYSISCVYFSIEYLLRIWTADLMYPAMQPMHARLRYMRTFMAIIDLISLLPFYMPWLFPTTLIELRLIRALNLIHLFGSHHYVDALTAVKTVLMKKSRDLLCSMLVVIVLIMVAALLMYSIESAAQPNSFDNAFDGMWWAVNTLSTIGYGDIVPITIPGRCLSMVITLFGIMLVAVPGGIITAGFIEGVDDRHRFKSKHICPHCGKEIE